MCIGNVDRSRRAVGGLEEENERRLGKNCPSFGLAGWLVAAALGGEISSLPEEGARGPHEQQTQCARTHVDSSFD